MHVPGSSNARYPLADDGLNVGRHRVRQLELSNVAVVSLPRIRQRAKFSRARGIQWIEANGRLLCPPVSGLMSQFLCGQADDGRSRVSAFISNPNRTHDRVCRARPLRSLPRARRSRITALLRRLRSFPIWEGPQLRPPNHRTTNVNPVFASAARTITPTR